MAVRVQRLLDVFMSESITDRDDGNAIRYEQGCAGMSQIVKRSGLNSSRCILQILIYDFVKVKLRVWLFFTGVAVRYSA